MDVATPHVFEVQCNIEQNVQTFLNAHGTDVPDQVRLAKFEGGIGRNGLKGHEIGPVSNNENVTRIHSSPGYGEFPVAVISGHDYVAESVGQAFEPDLGLVKEVFSFELGKVEFRVRIVMIEDIFHAQEFEREGDQKNIVRRITALNHVETVPKINPPGVEELPKQCAANSRRYPRGLFPSFGIGCR